MTLSPQEALETPGAGRRPAGPQTPADSDRHTWGCLVALWGGEGASPSDVRLWRGGHTRKRKGQTGTCSFEGLTLSPPGRLLFTRHCTSDNLLFLPREWLITLRFPGHRKR